MALPTLRLAGDLDRGPAGEDIEQAARLVGRFPTIVAAYWRLLRGLEPVAPRAELGHVANYLYMIDGRGAGREAARALETYLNTVVDHGMNASTFTARVIASTGSDMVSALVGAVGALKGPLHGGAPGPALDMVFAMRERAAAQRHGAGRRRRRRWVRETLAAGGRVMGFGHRVYKVRDPRAEVLGAAAVRLFERAPATRGCTTTRGVVEDVVLRRPARAQAGAAAGDQRRVLHRAAAARRRAARASCSRRPSRWPAPAAGRRTSWSRERRTA